MLKINNHPFGRPWSHDPSAPVRPGVREATPPRAPEEIVREAMRMLQKWKLHEEVKNTSLEAKKLLELRNLFKQSWPFCCSNGMPKKLVNWLTGWNPVVLNNGLIKSLTYKKGRPRAVRRPLGDGRGLDGFFSHQHEDPWVSHGFSAGGYHQFTQCSMSKSCSKPWDFVFPNSETLNIWSFWSIPIRVGNAFVTYLMFETIYVYDTTVPTAIWQCPSCSWLLG